MRKFNRKKAILCGFIFILFVFVAVIMVFDKKMIIDEAIYNFIFSFRCNFLDNYFTFITHFGDTVFIVGFVAAFMLVYRQNEGLFLSVSTVNAALLTLIFKHIFLRSRPSHLRLVEQGGYSFPSGHAMVSICVYGYLLYLALKIRNKALRYVTVGLLSLLIISIGISRIYVGVHYPTDVMAGYLLGIIEVIFITEVLHLYKTRGD